MVAIPIVGTALDKHRAPLAFGLLAVFVAVTALADLRVPAPARDAVTTAGAAA